MKKFQQCRCISYRKINAPILAHTLTVHKTLHSSFAASPQKLQLPFHELDAWVFARIYLH
eukprot:c42133_g1_i1 orf=66-245(+)